MNEQTQSGFIWAKEAVLEWANLIAKRKRISRLVELSDGEVFLNVLQGVHGFELVSSVPTADPQAYNLSMRISVMETVSNSLIRYAYRSMMKNVSQFVLNYKAMCIDEDGVEILKLVAVLLCVVEHSDRAHKTNNLAVYMDNMTQDGKRLIQIMIEQSFHFINMNLVKSPQANPSPSKTKLIDQFIELNIKIEEGENQKQNLTDELAEERIKIQRLLQEKSEFQERFEFQKGELEASVNIRASLVAKLQDAQESRLELQRLLIAAKQKLSEAETQLQLELLAHKQTAASQQKTKSLLDKLKQVNLDYEERVQCLEAEIRQLCLRNEELGHINHSLQLQIEELTEKNEPSVLRSPLKVVPPKCLETIMSESEMDEDKAMRDSLTDLSQYPLDNIVSSIMRSQQIGSPYSLEKVQTASKENIDPNICAFGQDVDKIKAENNQLKAILSLLEDGLGEYEGKEQRRAERITSFTKRVERIFRHWKQ